MICYLILFFLFSFDKVFYIARKEGNNPNKYFIFKIDEYNKDLVSRVYDDDLKNKQKNNHHIILKYIYLYKFCSKVFKTNKKRIKSISRKTKI